MHVIYKALQCTINIGVWVCARSRACLHVCYDGFLFEVVKILLSLKVETSFSRVRTTGSIMWLNNEMQKDELESRTRGRARPGAVSVPWYTFLLQRYSISRSILYIDKQTVIITNNRIGLRMTPVTHILIQNLDTCIRNALFHAHIYVNITLYMHIKSIWTYFFKQMLDTPYII